MKRPSNSFTTGASGPGQNNCRLTATGFVGCCAQGEALEKREQALNGLLNGRNKSFRPSL